MSFEPILLAPQAEEREIFPYGRVWRSAIIEVAFLLAVTVAVIVMVRVYQAEPSPNQGRAVGIGLALLPAGLWLLFSYANERRVPQPRSGLLTVALLTGLAANAIGLPLVQGVFGVDTWLATAPGTTRIIGYAMTTGIVQEFIKYAVMRYSVWPRSFRTRSDGIAFALAAATGYATVLNLNYVLTSSAHPDALALRVAEITLTQFAISTIVGYFLAELKLNSMNMGVYWLPGGLLFAALLTGLATTIRGGVIVSAIGPNSTASNLIQGIGVSIFLLTVLFAAFYFLINNADERSRSRSRPEYQR